MRLKHVVRLKQQAAGAQNTVYIQAIVLHVLYINTDPSFHGEPAASQSTGLCSKVTSTNDVS
jgi:hypothetical protein